MEFSIRNGGGVILLMFIMLGLTEWCINGENDESLSIGAPMVKTEQEALYSAIQGFVGNWWNGSDLYPDPCGWTPIQGVSCDLFDGFWYVTDLDIGPIHDNSLGCAPNVEFRPHLYQLKHLKSLSFFNCFVSPRIAIPSGNWDAFSGSLESLEFRSNPGLTGQIPTTFGQLQRLQSLVLVENGLSGGLPDSIGNLIHLKRLVISGNWFTGKIPDSYGYLRELLILDLSRNSLSGTLPLTFRELTSLLKLDLSKNQLQGKIPSDISNLKNLTLLDLSKNNISGGLTTSIQEMSSLEELVLSGNPTGGDLMKFDWQNLQGLMVLDLSNMQLTGSIPESISKLKRLRFLGLNDNNLSGNLPPKLAELPNISALYVQGNNLRGELKFSQAFYSRMGRRFGAWNNSNLCFPVGLMPTTNNPFGVKDCGEEVVKLNEVNLLEIDSKSGSSLMTSFGFSSYQVHGIWCILTIATVLNLM